MTTPARPDRDDDPAPPETLPGWPILVALGAAFLAQIYAGLSLLALYGDGAYCLRAILSSRRFACIEPPRRAIQFLLEFETIAAVRLGLSNLSVADAIFGLSLQLTPLLLVCLTCAVVWRDHRRFVLPPVFDYFAGSSGIASNQMLEGPSAAAYFWLLLMLLLFRSQTLAQCLVLGLAALPAVVSHEVMVFLAPLLAAVAWLRAAQASSPTIRLLMRGLAIWFAIVACVQIEFVLHPSHRENRDNFVAQMLAFKWFYAAGIGLNVPAVLGLLAMAAALGVWGWPRAAHLWLASFAAAAVVLVGGMLALPELRAPVMQFYAREQPALVSVPLALLTLWAWRAPHGLPLRPIASLLLVLGLVTSAAQAIVTADWSRYTAAFRTVLSEGTGVVAWETMTRNLPADRGQLFRRMDWGWTYPDLSLVLAEQGVVHTIIANPVDQGWQPWNPASRSAWPASVFWSYSVQY